MVAERGKSRAVAEGAPMRVRARVMGIEPPSSCSAFLISRGPITRSADVGDGERGRLRCVRRHLRSAPQVSENLHLDSLRDRQPPDVGAVSGKCRSKGLYEPAIVAAPPRPERSLR